MRIMLLDRKVLHYLLVFPFLLMKGHAYQTTLQVFSQTTVYVRSVCREERRETNRQEKLQLLGELLSPHELQDSLRALQEWRLPTSKTRSQMTCQRVTERHTLIQLKLQEEQLLKTKQKKTPSSSNHITQIS